MPEAEDVIVDVARHATVFIQNLWQRHQREPLAGCIDLLQLMHRLDLLVTGIFGSGLRIHLAQAPPPRPFVRRLFRHYEQPSARQAIPATDGHSIWLPAPLPGSNANTVLCDLRIMVLQQAARAMRGSTLMADRFEPSLDRAVYEILEADAADAYLARKLDGLRPALLQFRSQTLQRRPPLSSFPEARTALERWVRSVMQESPAAAFPDFIESPHHSMRHARSIARQLLGTASPNIAGILFRDAWTGELRASKPVCTSDRTTDVADEAAIDRKSPRSARLARRPAIRATDERDERRGNADAWMIQTTQPHEHAEDPFGLQRPTDRDQSTPVDDLADSVSELPEARLVSTPGAPKDVLLCDDPPELHSKHFTQGKSQHPHVLHYPEWDWRTRSYRKPGAAVRLLPPSPGPPEWVTRILDEHRTMLHAIRRQFESLRAQRQRLRKQTDGDEPDIEACIDGYADVRAGGSVADGLYQISRTTRRELAVLLLIDVSGSTDSWVSSTRRIIDVEREALLLVCLALQSLGESYSVLAFSGEGPDAVTVRSIKRFSEHYGQDVALRIAGLEPERYTRAGAAIRHASSLLMQESARHRLLLLLSDGKPNDIDEYEGHYGVEDMRQAVVEARLQGISSFCLTIDRYTANYLPAVFGEHQYAVLHRPELLPTALLAWMRRLVHA